jgi:hypothetical protein
MNAELLELIELVRNSPRPVQEVVESYMDSIVWSLLKQEWLRLTIQERTSLINKLTTERKLK